MYSANFSMFNLYSINVKNEGENFNFETSKLRHRIANFLKKEDYARLFSQNIEEISKFLQNLNYPFIAQHSFSTNITDIEHHFISGIKTVISNLLKDKGGEKASLVEEYFLIPYDFLNLKTLYKGLKENISFQDLKLIPEGFLQEKHLLQIYNGKDIGFLPLTLKKYIRQYQNFVQEETTTLEIDQQWDKYLHQFYFDLINQYKSDFLKRFYMLQVDIKNILTFLRLKDKEKDLKEIRSLYIQNGNLNFASIMDTYKYNVEDIIDYFSYMLYAPEIRAGLESYKETQSLSELEKLLQQYLLKILKRMSHRLQTEELLIAYFWLKLSEINNIKILLISKTNNVHKDWALEKMRFIYE
jgi:V/A-type H+-transporting ATPase subunit C